MKTQLTVAVLTVLAFPIQADINISGFASINGGKVLSGEGVFGNEPMFLADYPIVSAYTEDFSMSPESLIGLQFSSQLGEGLSATGQMVSRGADDYDVSFEWAYISYELNDNWTLQAGKKRLPLFYYSDFYDVGYAYVWMRPPADNYTWQIFNYNGINALYTGEWQDWSITGNIYTGREDDTNNKLLSEFFFFEPTREIWKNIIGGVIQVSNDWLEVRATHMRYTNERYRAGEAVVWSSTGTTERDGKFYGLSVNVNYGDAFLLTELNRLDLDGNFDTYMISVGYHFGSLTPYFSYADFEAEMSAESPDLEHHDTTSVGVRWDFHSSAAFKLQYDKVDDHSFDLAVAGDSKSITFGVDIVF